MKLDASKELLRRSADVSHMLTWCDKKLQMQLFERGVTAEAIQTAWDEQAGLRFAFGDSSGDEGIIDCDSGQGPAQGYRYEPYFFKMQRGSEGRQYRRRYKPVLTLMAL